MSTYMRGPLEARFWAKVDRRGPDDCWAWTGCRANGYGRLGGVGREVLLAHRVSYEIHVGPIPDGMFVCHYCDNPPCVNPARLFLGTQRDNMADANGKGRVVPPPHPSGAEHPRARLTEADVREIRRRVDRGEPPASLGREFGVTDSNIARLVRRLTWRDVA